MAISDSSYNELARQTYNIELRKAKFNDVPIVLMERLLAGEFNL
ncbi:hypothetical protein [Streptococcus equi]|uniref:Uncharacterized protein n=1 Tax=Streptococcus equi subsp. ruminatorum CECT 5772 TaxID=1051981 RepID=A0A922NT62_9STRE|nr:hypothetical protein [Streptococcus equi]ASB95847.1 hypothetical protein SE071780_00230 [Streptococcus equi subsp. equi]KED03772.1 hypothetical protein CECT5772_09322 [Streptococcus equi subsp. ruminatorum CECT 5772]WGS35431.1 hypothetical protein P1X07_01115 [Streptococcus equi]WOK45811.1 hypothetical protein RIM74_00785 [Streptococcus equi subsp. equi]WOK47674.1 hypothetical protein RIM73_00785 [Streptococcus equi subsp. equi]